MTPDYWSTAKAQLSAADKVMAKLIAGYPGELMQTRGDAFYTLCRSIVGQQISVKAADSIWNRFEAQLKAVKPKHLDVQSDENLRACGLSYQKIRYLRAIAEHFEKNKVKKGYFDAMSDKEAIDFLCEIKGVGRWTAEMFLMFHLMRPDVLPLDDIGLHKAIERHYNLPRHKDKKRHYADMRAVAEVWQPWRTVATWYLWRSLDPLPVAY